MTYSRQFVLCGHRGNMAEAAENTLASFASAERVGVAEIELDVKVTHDGALVVIHDRTVERTAASPTPYLRTPVEQLTLEELRTVDLGNGERVPTFEEALDATSVLLQVEIKSPDAARPLAQMLRNRGEADQARCVITSFDPLSLADFAAEWPDPPRGIALHVPNLDTNWREQIRRLGVSTVYIPLSIVTRRIVDELHADGYLVGASLIENPGDVRRVVELDIDGSASNAPALARRLLEQNEEFTARFPTFIAEGGGVLTPDAV